MQTAANARKMQRKQAAALAQLQRAYKLLNTVDACIAKATYTLHTDGAYVCDEGDVVSIVREHIAEMESLLKQYVN